MVEWVKKAELICKMLSVKHLEHIILLIYQQLGEKERGDINQIKSTLYMSFAVDGFMAYEQFREPILHIGNKT